MVPELLVKEGEDIDYRIVLAFYLLADLGECGHMSPSGEGVGALRSLVMLPPNTAPVCMIVFVACFIFAREEGYWVVTIPFLPLTLWMLMKVPPPCQHRCPLRGHPAVLLPACFHFSQPPLPWHALTRSRAGSHPAGTKSAGGSGHESGKVQVIRDSGHLRGCCEEHDLL